MHSTPRVLLVLFLKDIFDKIRKKVEGRKVDDKRARIKCQCLDQEAIKKWYDEQMCSSRGLYTQQSIGSARFYIYRKILNHLRPKGGEPLLDVACGTGLFLSVVEKETGALTYGLDISRSVHVAKRFSNSQLLISSGENIPFISHSFRCVTILGSLEHFVNPEKGLDEICRVATDDASICILVPNLHYLFGAGTTQPRELLLSLMGWMRVIESHGFKVETVLQDDHPKCQINIFQDKKLPATIARLTTRLIWVLMPLDLTCQFIFICHKK
jgi:SAM-dependent methyltransferase